MARKPESTVYALFAQAIRQRRPLTCVYSGRRREVCPIILGHTNGEERALTYQFGGESSSKRLPPGGAWRCLSLSEVSEVALREGPWVTGSSHSQPQGCVADVDLDVNPDSPYRPRRPAVTTASGAGKRARYRRARGKGS
jgi:hypothetical protein